MKAQLYRAAGWLNADPRRTKVLSFVMLAAFGFAAHFIPGGVALAGPAPGGSDVH